MWTKTSLQTLAREKFSDYLFIAVSNRQPYVHMRNKAGIKVNHGSGGVITALDPIMQACKGLWVVWGDGDADKKVCDSKGRLSVPPGDPSYTLKRIWLSKEEEIGYYHGFSNEALWPLCHTAFNRPVFRQEDWAMYRQVNAKFAQAISEEVGDRKAFVWIQDYHLCLLPRMLKEKLGNRVITAHFWHIPWPSYEIFRILPQKHELLEGLLANDLIGFHTRYHCNNFTDVVDRELECKIDREKQAVVRGGHETLVRPYPISIDYENVRETAASPAMAEAEKALADEFNLAGKQVILGLDRIDYTKGIPERLLAMDRLLEKHPELKEKIIFLQMGELSRMHVTRYKQLNDEINALVEQINWKHSTDEWRPVTLVRRHLNFPEPLAFYRLADVCAVTSLHDGMNLVAKEFIAVTEKGMLVLSRFTGASRELGDAVLINPFDREEAADALYEALVLPVEERKRRLERMKATLSENNIYRWAGKIMSELFRMEFKE